MKTKDTLSPIEKKALALGAKITLGKGKKEFLEKLVRDSIGKHCVYCKDMLVLETLSLDHIKPFGETKLRVNKVYAKALNIQDNLQIICKRCNAMKSNLPHEKFMKLLAFLDTDIVLREYVFKRLAQSNVMWSFRKGRSCKCYV